MLGPTGVGVLWARPELLDRMDPFMGGGEMINSVSIENTTWAEPPLKFEAGTSNFADVAAFAVALDYLDNLGLDAIHAHQKALSDYAAERLAGLPEVTVYRGVNAAPYSGAVSFNHKVVHAHDVGTILSDEGVAIRVGHHCAQPLMRALKAPATARCSVYIYNTREDVDALIEGLKKVDHVFGLTGAKHA
jgi:cysteine desulfurase/selenocysteine lyase